MNKFKTWLTAMIVITITAIAAVGFFLIWDIFDFDGKLTELLDGNFFGEEAPLIKSDVVVNLDSEKAMGLPEKERELLCNYFTCYFASLGSYYHENITRFYSFQAVDGLIDDMVLSSEINSAKTAVINYSYDECTVRLTVLSRRSGGRENPNGAYLEVLINAEIPYSFTDSSMIILDEKHTFLIETYDGDCLIAEHSSDRPARLAGVAALESAISEKGYTPSDLSYTYYEPYLKRAAALLEKGTEALRETVSVNFCEELTPLFGAEYPYERKDAVAYAESASVHSAVYGEYDNNDANFCSQCVRSGGIPMDDQGERLTQWKWYGYDENYAREKSGCTKSWFDRSAFYTYAIENSGFGLVSQESLSGAAGDIIQLMSDDEPILEAVITEVIFDNNGKAADYLICTDRLKNIPLSLLNAGDYRIINIIGYNTANI